MEKEETPTLEWAEPVEAPTAGQHTVARRRMEETCRSYAIKEGKELGRLI